MAADFALRQNSFGLTRYYINNLLSVARKGTIKLDPDMKRCICKRCNLLLVPGITASVRYKGKPQKRVTVRCVSCQETKRFLSNDKYKLWIEKAESKLESHVTDQVGRGQSSQPQQTVSVETAVTSKTSPSAVEQSCSKDTVSTQTANNVQETCCLEEKCSPEGNDTEKQTKDCDGHKT